MFEVEQFIDDCRNALKEQQAQKAVHEIVARAVANPEQIIKALESPRPSASAACSRSTTDKPSWRWKTQPPS
jgi:hypothetical protein